MNGGGVEDSMLVIDHKHVLKKKKKERRSTLSRKDVKKIFSGSPESPQSPTSLEKENRRFPQNENLTPTKSQNEGKNKKEPSKKITGETKSIFEEDEEEGLDLDIFASIGQTEIFYNKKEDRMTILMFFVSQQLLVEQFQQSLVSITCGTRILKHENSELNGVFANQDNPKVFKDKVFMFKNYKDIHLIMVSRYKKMQESLRMNDEELHEEDQDEIPIEIEEESSDTKNTDSYEVANVVQLDRFLKIFYKLLKFRVNLDSKESKLGMGLNKTQKFMKPLIASLEDLMKTEQFVLFKCLEAVKIDQFRMRNKINLMLKEVCSNEPPLIYHAIVLINNKILGIYSKPCYRWVLQPSDILNLIIFSNAFKKKKIGSNIYQSVYLYLEGVKKMKFSLFLSNFAVNFNKGLVDTKKEDSETVFSILFVCNYDHNETQKEILQGLAKDVKKELKNFSYEFLSIKESHHFTVKHFFSDFPGLIHFVLIDKLRKLMFAPRICSISKVLTKDKVFSLVKEMIETLEPYKKRNKGSNQIIISNDFVTFSYHQCLINQKGSPQIYNLNNLKTAKGHYELFTIYVPRLKSGEIESHNQQLVKRLLNELS